MKALVIKENKGVISSQIENLDRPPCPAGHVLIKAEYSSLNFKDALGVTGRGRIYKMASIIGGIDVAGSVIESKDRRFKAGDPVLVTGCGLGETHNGGFSEFVVENADHVVARPKGLSAREAMIYGTAGFTAALVLERMEQNGQSPDKGAIVVTGASGGVGQFAVQMFTAKKYKVWALSGKDSAVERLKSLGAERVMPPNEMKLATRPLEAVVIGGVVDNVGGPLLAGLIPQVQLWGNVACVGLADNADLHTTVMPLILRGVSILGVSSNNTPWDMRLKIWQRLSQEHKKSLDGFVTQEIPLEKIVATAQKMLARETTGRILVKCQ